MKEFLEIGKIGKFEDGEAQVIGKLLFTEPEEGNVDYTLWQMQSNEGEFFFIREYLEEDKPFYEILSPIEAEEDDDSVIADELFADWKNLSNLIMRSNITLKTVDGEVKTNMTEGDVYKVADISFAEDEEEDMELDADEVLVDTCVIWNEDKLWVYGIEYLEESDMEKMFA